MADQMVMLNFDVKGKWIGYMVLTDAKTYNFFDLKDEWTGAFACTDSDSGMNIFNKDGEWTGEFAK